MTNLVDRIINRIEYNSYVNAIDLSLFRILTGLFILFVYSPAWRIVGNFPQAFFEPRLFSFAYFFSDFPHPVFFIVLDILFYICVAAFSLGIFARYTLVAAFILAIAGNSFFFSIGKVSHDILLWLSLVFLAFTNCGRHFSMRPSKPVSPGVQKTSLGLFSLFIAYAMFTAGIHKLVQWVDFDLSTSGFLRWFYNGYFNMQRTELFADMVFDIPPVIVELMDYSAVAFEITGLIFLLWNRISWRGYLIIAVIFHMANTFLLNIQFDFHVVVYGVFLISPVLGYFITRLSARQLLFLKCAVVLFVLGKVVLIFFRISNNHPIFLAEGSSYFSRSFVPGVILWTVMLLSAFFALRKNLYLDPDLDRKEHL